MEFVYQSMTLVLLGMMMDYVSLAIKVIMFWMEFVLELIKQHQKTKDVRHGIGIGKSVLSAHTDTWVEMVVVYLWMTPARRGIQKDFVILAIRAIMFQMEFV